MEKILQPFRSNASLTSSSEARHDQAMKTDKHSSHNLGVSVHCYSTLEECHSHQNIAQNVIVCLFYCFKLRFDERKIQSAPDTAIC